MNIIRHNEIKWKYLVKQKIECSYFHDLRVTCVFVSEGISSRFPRFKFNARCLSCRKNENVLEDLRFFPLSPRFSGAFIFYDKKTFRILELVNNERKI